MVGLGVAGATLSGASDASIGGAVIVGAISGGPAAPGANEAFYWTQEEGIVLLGYLPGGAIGSAAGAISADGSLIVGSSGEGTTKQAMGWTQDVGMFGLGDLPGGDFDSCAWNVSLDGSTVVGWGTSDEGKQAMRWTRGEGMTSLGGLPDADELGSIAQGVSQDGSVIVGFSSGQAFRWTAIDGVQGLGDLPGGNFFSTADAVTADGTTVVGMSSAASGPTAFIWDAEHGMRDLREVLFSEVGLNLTGWHLEEATGISADGSAICGHGKNPDDQPEAWFVRIRPADPTDPWSDLLAGERPAQDLGEQECCGAAGPMAPLGLLAGMVLLGLQSGDRKRRGGPARPGECPRN